MKISAETVAILANFATINKNILFRAGSTISVLSAYGSVYARADIEECFPRQFAVADLYQFLKVIQSVPDASLDFEASFVRIYNDDFEVQYFYTDENAIFAAPDKDIVLREADSFTLSKAHLSSLFKAAQNLGSNLIVFSGNGKDIRVETKNSKQGYDSNFAIKSLKKSDLKFKFFVAAENINPMPGDYTVTIPFGKFVHFSSPSRSIQYWFGVNPNSTLPSES